MKGAIFWIYYSSTWGYADSWSSNSKSVNVVDDQLRKPDHGDGATIGILLAATRDGITVEYALRGIDSPLAVSTYTTYRALPYDIQPSLPTAD